MENFNNVPSSGTFGSVVSVVNQNFALAKEAIDKLAFSKSACMGFYETSSDLETAYPTPTDGDWALVGGEFSIYQAKNGEWSDTGLDYNIPVRVVDNLTDGGSTSALSAEMGKIIRQNIDILLNSLGAYAFPNGKPNLNWGVVKHSITGSFTNITVGNITIDGESIQSIPAQIGNGQSLSFSFLPTNNMYVIDDDNLVVMMGGVDITSTAYNNSNVTISSVTGDIVITASSITYISDGLVFNLDGLNRGGSVGHWIDLIGNVDFTLTNCTENTDNVEFNGTSSKGVSNGSLNVLYDAGTIESIFDVSASNFPTSVQCILTNKLDNGISIGLGKGADPDVSKSLYCYGNNITSPIPITGLFGFNDVIKTKQQISISKGAGFRNGETLIDPYPNEEIMFKIDATTSLALGYRKRSSSENFMKGQIFAIRVYSRVLTTEERAQNYLVDKLRYNLG